MTEDDRHQIVISLATMIRRLGWEDLIEVRITPEDAARGQVDPGLARALVFQVTKVVRDLAAVEMALLAMSDGASTITFKPDIDESVADATEVGHRFDRGLMLNREQLNSRRQTFQILLKDLLTLEDAL